MCGNSTFEKYLAEQNIIVNEPVSDLDGVKGEFIASVDEKTKKPCKNQGKLGCSGTCGLAAAMAGGQK